MVYTFFKQQHLLGNYMYNGFIKKMKSSVKYIFLDFVHVRQVNRQALKSTPFLHFMVLQCLLECDKDISQTNSTKEFNTVAKTHLRAQDVFEVILLLYVRGLLFPGMTVLIQRHLLVGTLRNNASEEKGG